MVEAWMLSPPHRRVILARAFTDTNIVGRVLADEQGRAAVEDLLVRQKAKAKALLSANTHLVEALRGRAPIVFV